MIRLPVPDPKLQDLVRAIERTHAEIDPQGVFQQLPGNYANDAAAAAGGVPLNGIYRNGSVLMVRTA